ncbi:PAS domain-containing sensor histidine kinase [Nonomuraea soli]|uniref:histidine kinase n=1 Tax=Nonomuraea soli TaxID=1032476 RepID=A0A7W0HNY2_9ACTN|nr:PAS domain-containing sensor histidine kinase [Nonomuraea soli]MBA2890182.1 signal transduction histidine kinase [Nonomuraea soli]
MDEIDFGAAFEAAPIALALLSPDLIFIAVNQAYERLVGRSRADVVGRDVFDVFPGGPATTEAAVLRASLERVLADAETDVMPLLRYDVESVGGSAPEERYWSITNAPLLDSHGDVCGVVNLPQEVTGFVRRVREAGHTLSAGAGLSRLAAVEAHLYAQTGQLQDINRRLRRAQDRAQRATQKLNQVVQQHREAVADTSHDLRGPIAGLQLRLQDALADPDVDARQILLAALRDAERLGDIVGDLLELARLEAGAPQGVEAVDLAILVGKELLHRPARVKFVTRLESGVKVAGSPVRLTRLVGNLLANAIRHARSRVEVTVGVDGRDAVLEVADDGPGIPAADREAVFQRFFRRSDAMRADPAGSGLGLPIARQIAQSHGGTLEIADPDGAAASAPDAPGGAHLVLRLPLLPSSR